GELRAAVALVPHLPRQCHHVRLAPAEALEEARPVGEREETRQSELPPLLVTRLDERASVTGRLPVLTDRERLHLRTVGPGDVQRSARHDLVALTDDEEVAQVFIGLAEGAREHLTLRRPEVHEA